MRRILRFLKKEALEMLPPTLFFLVVFHGVIVVRRLAGEEGEGDYLTSSATAVVGALMIGKAVLVADALPLFRLFQERLILNVGWRTCLYLGVALGFQLLEELLPLIPAYGGLGAALGRLGDEIHWARFWATHLVLAVFLLFYTFSTALIRVIGIDEFLRIFFGWRRGGGGASPADASR